jgi:hypothetical protein
MGGRNVRKRRSRRLLHRNSTIPSRRSSFTSSTSNKPPQIVVKKRRPPRVYCICRKTYRGQFMIQCETCLEWYHGTCIQLTFEQSKYIDAYYCTLCTTTTTTNRSHEDPLISSSSSSPSSIPVATATMTVFSSTSGKSPQENQSFPGDFRSSLVLNIDGFLSILQHIHDLGDLSTMGLICKRWRIFVKSYMSVSVMLMNSNTIPKQSLMAIDFVDVMKNHDFHCHHKVTLEDRFSR